MKRGRPKKENARTERLEMRLTVDELRTLEQCSKELNTTKTETLIIGLNMVKKEIENKKTV